MAAGLRRGEIWTVLGSTDYVGKPRPALIIQDDFFLDSVGITLCPFTTDPSETPLARPEFVPNDLNNLRQPSRLMIDKVTTVPRVKLGKRIGNLDDSDMIRVNRALVVFLGLASSGKARPD